MRMSVSRARSSFPKLKNKKKYTGIKHKVKDNGKNLEI